MLRNTDHSWGAPAKVLHWGVALLVFVQFGLGWAAASWRMSPIKVDLFCLQQVDRHADPAANACAHRVGVCYMRLRHCRPAWQRRWNGAPRAPTTSSSPVAFADGRRIAAVFQRAPGRRRLLLHRPCGRAKPVGIDQQEAAMTISSRLTGYLAQRGARYDVCAHDHSQSSAQTARLAHIPDISWPNR